MDYRIAKKMKRIGTLALCLGSIGPALANASSAQALDQLSSSEAGIAAQARNCYGYVCPEPAQTENNCDDAVIDRNVAALNSLNIVTATGLAAFQCHGYCFTNNTEGHQADKCEKADALDKLVKAAAPLAVKIKN